MKRLTLILALAITAFAADVPNRGNAINAAHALILNQLKAPATAQFQPDDQARVELKRKNTRYVVTTWVDSQNSFGVMLRTTMTCFIDSKDGGETFDLKRAICTH